MRKRIVSLLLALLFITTTPLTALAETDNSAENTITNNTAGQQEDADTASDGDAKPAAGKEAETDASSDTASNPEKSADTAKPTITITAFAPLDAAVQTQTLKVGASEDRLTLPIELSAFDENNSPVSLKNITWKANSKFNSNAENSIIYTAVLPDGYLLKNCTLPVINVTIAKIASLFSGITVSPSAVAGKSLTNTISVTPGFGRTIYLQMYQSSSKTWVNKGTFKTENTLTSRVKITYPKEWYSDLTTSWRLHAPETNSGLAITSPTIKVTAKRVYQNPSQYHQIKTKITLKSNAGYKLRRGSMGLKVAMVQRKLKMGRRWEIMNSATIKKVKAFQKKKKLKVTGVVDLKTWKKMGFSENDWYNKGAYVSPMKVDLTSTKQDHIEAMIANARRYLGTEYIVGAAGKPGTGIDCSGLVMQSMYAAGVDPSPVSVIRHSQPGYEYESRNLWKSKKLKTVPYSKRQRGDLIFYQSSGGVVIHVAIYLGNNKVIESWPEKVVIWPVKNSHRSNIKGVKRVFN